MGLVIGMDEAGYGPNLGPLVITVSVWEVPGHPRDTDFWAELRDVVSQERPNSDDQLQIADSKQVYSPGKGLRQLERGVHSVLTQRQAPLNSLHQLTAWLTHSAINENGESLLNIEPWFQNTDLKLPLECEALELSAPVTRLNRALSNAGIRLLSLRSDIVLTERFNELTREYGSKGLTLSRSTLGLLRSVWNPDSDEATLVICDKHGGRNRYDDLLSEQLDGQMIQRQGEAREKSVYRVGRTELIFRTGAEAFFPVAVSSMVCKYLRESCMELFNQFWQKHMPELRPTKGYPEDARRFRSEIAKTQSSLAIPDSMLWRER